MRAFSARISPEQLTSLARDAFEAIDARWLIVSTRDHQRLAPAPPSPGALDDLASTLDGRLFGLEGDLRWRCDPGPHAPSVYVMLVARSSVSITWPGGAPSVTELIRPGPIGDAGARDCRQRLLRGTWDRAGAWRDGRLPRPLDYGLRGREPGDRVAIAVEELLSKRDPRAADGGMCSYAGSVVERFVDVHLVDFRGEQRNE